MSQEFKYLTQIENYINDILSKEEKLDFEKQLTENNALAEELKLYQNMMGGIDLEGTDLMRNELKEIQTKLAKENAFNQETTKTTRIIKMENPKKSNRNWLAIAAGVLVLIVAGILLQSPEKITRAEALAKFDTSSSVNELLDTQINEYEGLGMADPERGKKDSIAQILREYKGGKYQESYNAATEFLAHYPNDAVAQYYAGMSKFQDGKYGKAVEWLSTSVQQKEMPFYDQSRWYLALSYTMLATTTGDDNAIKLFQQIIDTPDSKFRTEAQWHLEFLKSN